MDEFIWAGVAGDAVVRCGVGPRVGDDSDGGKCSEAGRREPRDGDLGEGHDDVHLHLEEDDDVGGGHRGPAGDCQVRG